MRAIILFCGIIAISLSFDGCKKEPAVVVQGMDLQLLTSGTKGTVGYIQMYISTDASNDTVRNVSSSLNIIATFSNDIDINSITRSSVAILHGVDSLEVNFVVVGNVLYIAPTTVFLTGASLRLIIANDLVASTSGFKYQGRTVDFITAGVGIDTPPKSSNQILYVQFDGNVGDLTGNDSVTFSSIGYTVDRFGTAGLAGLFTPSVAPGGGSIVEFFKFQPTPYHQIAQTPQIPTSMTISVWLNIANLNYRSTQDTIPARPILGLAADLGFYVEIEDSVQGPSDINLETNYNMNFKPVKDKYTGAYGTGRSVESLLTDGWHHLVITYDTTAKRALYIDGGIIYNWTSAPGNLSLNATQSVDPSLTLGYYCSRENSASPNFIYSTDRRTFAGAMDDLRIYNIALSSASVKKLYEEEKPTQ